VKPWVELARAKPEGTGVLSLHRRDDEYVIKVDGELLMSSRRHESEDQLATIGCAHMRGAAPRILVGGLGMGYTLRAVLDLLPARGEAVVAEISADVVDWNRGVLADLARRPLDDARVRVHVGDVLEAMRAAPAAYDAILLDIDNSPHALTRAANRALYDERGLAAALRALRPGGCLAVWSAAETPEFERRMKKAGFAVGAHAAHARPGGGGRHTIYTGTARGRPAE
jgi:spermidine synthase